MSLRRVAEALSVTPMALYRYVESREDLLGGVADLVLREAAVTDHPADDWRDWACAAFTKIRDALDAQAGAAALLPHVPLGDPHHVTAEAITARLRGSGIARDEARALYLDLVRYTLGCVALGRSTPGSLRATPSAFEAALRRLMA